MMCIYGSKDCDGSCLDCETSKSYLEDDYGTAINYGDTYYYIGGELIAADNIEKWLDDYKTVAI